ncbi:MAG: hypothetical protein RL375_3909, partial [Pseudomonadota bacterium]
STCLDCARRPRGPGVQPGQPDPADPAPDQGRKGESTIQGDTVSTRSDMTVVERGQTHRIQSESEMRFVKSDCGKVKPFTAPRRP